MSFTSPSFLIFFTVLCTLNYLVAPGVRRWLILAASLFFIGCFNLASLFTIILLSSLNFIAGKQVARQKNNILFCSMIAGNGLAIVVNNYLLSVNGQILFRFGSGDFKLSDLLLLAGLSFYGLQHIAYLADVRLKKINPETDYWNFLWASCYFPKFISGPVTPYPLLRAQLPVQKPSSELMWQGFHRLLLGFLKKMVLADRLAPSVSSVFDYHDALPGMTIFMAAVCFTIQLYFDFSGYCDIAIGASKMLGVELPENFDFPLRAGSVTVFWRKWHQSLIHFLTTYVFYPVSFRFRKLKRRAAVISIALTFFISAVWHGIGFTFMAWAFCHMIYLIVELHVRKNAITKTGLVARTASIAYVWILVSFSNLFFRATSTANALHLLAGLFDLPHFLPESWSVQFIAPLAVGGHQLEQFNLGVTVLFIAATLLFERRLFALCSSRRFRPVLTFILLLLIVMFGVFNSGQRFIYMQF